MANIPISSFTAAANTTGIGMSGFSLTGSNAQSIIDLAATWNTSGTPTGILLNVTDTASNAASKLIDLQVGGVSKFSVGKAFGGVSFGQAGDATTTKISLPQYSEVATANGRLAFSAGSNIRLYIEDGLTVFGNGLIGFSAGLNSTGLSSATDVTLRRDAANTLAQRNGVNAQTSRIYNTYTDASNYERGGVRWVSNVMIVGTEYAGTGTIRALRLQSYGGIIFDDGNSDMRITSGVFLLGGRNLSELRNLVFQTDNTYDIGASGASRPRNLFMGSYIRMATTVVASLPAAATAGAGARMFVTDALAPTFGSAVTGGGAVTVPVYSTGSAWNVG